MARELLFKVTRADFDETHYRGSGNGGQHRDKTSSGVRLVHRASGALGKAADSRDQPANRTAAFKRLRETTEWRLWFNEMCLVSQGRKSVQQQVEEAMAPENIVTQVLEDNRWVETSKEGDEK